MSLVLIITQNEKEKGIRSIDQSITLIMSAVGIGTIKNLVTTKKEKNPSINQ